MSDDDIIAAAGQLHKARPNLKPLDWRILGLVIRSGSDGLPMVYVRELMATTEIYGSLTSFNPAIDRLIAEGLIERRDMAYQATTYRGKSNRSPRMEIVFYRTATPINFVL